MTTTSSAQAWPVRAKLKNTALSFSGSFQPNRLAAEQRTIIFRYAGKILLALLITAGAAGLAASLISTFTGKSSGFILDRNIYNLAFWVALFLGCYLWAQTAQEQDNESALNLLHWETSGNNASLPAEIDVYDYFNRQAKKVWRDAYRLARAGHGTHAGVSAVDLLQALLEDRSIRNVCFRLSVNPADVKIFLRNYEYLADGEHSAELDHIPFVAFNEALKLRNRCVDPLMLLCALKIQMPENHVIQAIFFNLDVALEDLETVCGWQFNLDIMRNEVRLFRKLAGFKPGPRTNRGLTSLPTPYLDRYSLDLTLAAKYGNLPLALGRDYDLRSIFKLLGSGRRNICIKGGAGTGRHTLINELAYKMVTEQVPKTLADMRLVQLEPAAILGSRQRAEQVLAYCLAEADRSENIILVLTDIHTLARAQTSSGLSLLDITVDFLRSHNLCTLATTTPENYTEDLRPAAGFDQSFISYELRNLSKSEALLACCIKASLLEHSNHCVFRYPAIKLAMRLTDAYIKDANQPQKTVAILVEAASRAKSEPGRIVGTSLIETIISEKTHIPALTLGQDESAKLLNLEQDIGQYVIGQRAAVTAVAEGLRRARSGLTAENRPLASFLFLGPTGVGKTEVAKTLVRVYFGQTEGDKRYGEHFLFRLDMSEYQGEEGLDKLIGTAGSSADTPLVKHLKTYPFGLLLLDEFEKASSQVLNLFLQILDDARLTSGRGETIDLTHCLIIATSNAGSTDIQNGIKQGLTADQIKSRLFDQILTKYFPPELLNRFDGVVIFNPLTPQEITAIAHLQLQLLEHQLLDKGKKIRFTPAVAADIAQKSYDPSLGARPIRRYMQDHVETFVAKLILQHSLERGSEVVVDLKNGQLVVA